eukprot:gene11423-13499_t
MGYRTPTPIQKHAIPLMMEGRDVMCTAQTGSGKTCAFLLPTAVHLEATDPSPPEAPIGRRTTPARPRALILAPTRELAAQIHQEAMRLCHGAPSVKRPQTVYGGAGQMPQLGNLAKGVDVLVATPGRLQDFVDRKIINLDGVQVLVLDEADRMLDMGFEPQIRKLVERSGMPNQHRGRQTVMFSATFPKEIQRLAAAFQNDRVVHVEVGQVGSTTANITQHIVESPADKQDKLYDLLLPALEETPGRTIVFVRTKRIASWLRKNLAQKRIASEELHGDRSQ